MGQFSKQSVERIADVVRHVERSPINDPAGKKGRRPPSIGIQARIVKLKQQSTLQSVVQVQEYVPVVRDGNDEKIKSDDLSVGLTVLLEAKPGPFFYALNPRKNFLSVNVAYFAYKINGYWVIDNQAVFQGWDTSDFPAP